MPLVILIHGGAFIGGSKDNDEVAGQAPELLAQGFAVASIDYRLTDTDQFPANIEDVKSAIRWLRAHAKEFGLDPQRIAVWGVSAGSWLAEMAGVTSPVAEFGDPESGASAVQAVVAYYAPTDFTAMDAQLTDCGSKYQTHDDRGSPESQLMGGPIQEIDAATMAKANPIAWVNANTTGSIPPFLLVHGTKDCTVPPGQSSLLADALKSHDVPVQLDLVEGADHSVKVINEGRRTATIAFLKKTLVESGANDSTTDNTDNTSGDDKGDGKDGGSEDSGGTDTGSDGKGDDTKTDVDPGSDKGTDGSASTIPWHGWSSGAAGKGVVSGRFAIWRGSPTTIAGIWADGDEKSQVRMPDLAKNYSHWEQDLDIAIGGTVIGSGETYAEAASGVYDDRWIHQAKHLQRDRGNKAGLTYVRPFHGMNQSRFGEWFVTPENVTDYKAAFRRRVEILRKEFPKAVIVWSPINQSDPGAAPASDIYPGDDVVDVVGVSIFDSADDGVTDPESWQAFAEKGTDVDPIGVEQWRRFAESHGKPLALPEWGLSPNSGDQPAFIQGMNDWISAHAAGPGNLNVAGKIIYDIYFNVPQGKSVGYLITDASNSSSADVYKSLKWGNSQ